MEAILYSLIFIMGTFFGSFFTLAVYRIPLKQDILYTHSYCPNCKHKLGIIDLFPIFSYIALKGKCRYCGNKIRIRYLLLEVLTGLVFLLYAISFKFDVHYIFYEKYKLISLAFGVLYFVSLFIIAGIDKENRNIPTPMLIYSFAISIGYIIYVCTMLKKIVYSYAIYLVIMLIFIILNSILINKKQKNIYLIQIISFISFISIFSSIIGTIITVVIACIIGAVVYLIKKVKKQKIDKIPICFYLCISNIILTIITNYMGYYIYGVQLI